MKYGVHLPNFAEYGDPRLLVELAQEAEGAGWDGFFLWDHLQPEARLHLPVVDPWIALAAVATVTSRVRIGALVTPLARRRPWKVAREAVTLDHLSNGRLVLGVGLGEPPEGDFATFGEDPSPRVRAGKLDEGIEILLGLMSGEPVHFQGAYYQVEGATFLPRPVQSPRIPIWVGGAWPHRRPMRRAARLDGIFPDKVGVDWEKGEIMTPADLAEIVAFIRAERPTSAPFDVVLGGATPGDDPAAAAAKVAAYAAVGLTWWIEGINGLRGPLATMRQRIRQGPPRVAAGLHDESERLFKRFRGG